MKKILITILFLISFVSVSSAQDNTIKKINTRIDNVNLRIDTISGGSLNLGKEIDTARTDISNLGKEIDTARADIDSLEAGKLDNDSTTFATKVLLVKPYLVYTALITQSSTDAPTVVVLQNELSGPIVWSYDAIGTYFGTLSSTFLNNKVWASCNLLNPTYGTCGVGRVNDSTIVLFTADTGVVSDIGNTTNNKLPALKDGLLNSAVLEIRIYK